MEESLGEAVWDPGGEGERAALMLSRTSSTLAKRSKTGSSLTNSRS